MNYDNDVYNTVVLVYAIQFAFSQNFVFLQIEILIM